MKVRDFLDQMTAGVSATPALLDYDLGVIAVVQIAPEVRLNVRARDIRLQDRVDAANKTWWVRSTHLQ